MKRILSESLFAVSEIPVTHGRHCPCSACKAEDWTDPRLAPCGMHGADCPREYAPMRFGPDFLSGDDGEAFFVRRDLAASPRAALSVGLREGTNLAGYAVDLVQMLPVPEHFIEIEYEWAVVRDGTPHAVTYWRFRV